MILERLKHLLLATTALISSLPSVAAQQSEPITSHSRCSWSGFYTGASVGYLGTRDTVAYDDVGSGCTNVCGATSERSHGMIGGGQLGFNWQTGPIVVGIEADLGA